MSFMILSTHHYYQTHALSNSVVVLDNCAIHHVEEIVAAIESVGALVLYLPPYLPDFMPTEVLFIKHEGPRK